MVSRRSVVRSPGAGPVEGRTDLSKIRRFENLLVKKSHFLRTLFRFSYDGQSLYEEDETLGCESVKFVRY